MAASRLMRRRPRGAHRATGAAGVVAAAAVAHVSAGGPLPSPALLLLLTALLAVAAGRAPAPLRSGRAQLAAAALLQPVLHTIFDVVPANVSSTRLTDGLTLMLLAHGTAGVVSAWWLASGADRLVAAGVAVIATVRALLRGRSIRAAGPLLVLAQPRTRAMPRWRTLVVSPHRGPPHCTALPFSA